MSGEKLEFEKGWRRTVGDTDLEPVLAGVPTTRNVHVNAFKRNKRASSESQSA
jgi:hypothetical protein